MTLEELLAAPRPPDLIDLSQEELVRFFWKYKGLLKKWERANAYWATTNNNLKLAYEKLDEKEQELARAYELIQDDLSVASQIQQALMPKPRSTLDGSIDIAVYHKQLTEVGGDYYDFFKTRDGHRALGVFDISGHGVSAALVMAFLKAQFMQVMDRFESPKEIVEWVNSASYLFLREVKKYATVNFVVFGEQDVRYVAGGGFGLLVHQGQALTFENRQHFLGLRHRPFREHALPWGPGDLLALYTDGIIEAQNERVEDYTIRRLNDIILEHANDPVQVILDRCVKDYVEFRAQDTDDVTLIILRKNP
ncbi:MAG: SpoIIE family protein phosphatase [Alphaproteobacteria bacterium]|nr:SpoIIE family protein phosphatase [Alphaproteobacteria bacterium]